jgi:hypothetical protein
MNVWTEEQDNLLKELCASDQKLSAPTIAKIITETFEIIPPLSRAAVIGRARRRKITLPLPRKWGGVKWPPTDTGEPDVILRPKPVDVPRSSFASDERLPYRDDFLPEPVFGDGIFLINAGLRDCRWPINDPPKGQMLSLRVCGEATEEGSSYCPACIKADAKRPRPAEGAGGGPSGNIFILPSQHRGLK